MAIRTLPHEEWKAYFGAFALEAGRSGRVGYVVIRRAPPDGEGPPETRRLRFEGLAYNPTDDLFEVDGPGLRHFVLHPAEINVEETRGRLRRLSFVFRNGARETLDLP